MNSRYNWDAFSHQQLYDRIHGNGGFFLPDGAGVSGAAGAQDGWAELADLMARACIRTEAALAKAGAVWEGGAADAMRAGVMPLAQWAVDARTASTASADSTESHVSAYVSAKNRMPEPVPVANGEGGIPAGFTELFGGQTDQDKQEAAAQEAKAEAVRVMSGYEDESGAARASVGRFVPPPSVTVDVSPLRATGGDGIPVGVSEWPRVGRPVDDSIRPAGDIRAQGAAAAPLGGISAIAPSDITTASSSAKPSLTFNLSPAGLVSEQQRLGSLPVLPGGLNTVSGQGEHVRRGPVGRVFSDGGSGGRGSGGLRAGGSRGAVPGVGGLFNETVAGRSGSVGARGGSGLGIAPIGGRNDGEEDKEHFAAEYLHGPGDDFWDGAPPVAPAVIGDEDDD